MDFSVNRVEVPGIKKMGDIRATHGLNFTGDFLIDFTALDPSVGDPTKSIALWTARQAPQSGSNGYPDVIKAEITLTPIAVGAVAHANLTRWQSPITSTVAGPLENVSTGVQTVESNLNDTIDVVAPAYGVIDDVTSAHLSAYNNALAALQEEVTLIREILESLKS